MKKLVFLALFTLVTLVSNAQASWFKATSFCYKEPSDIYWSEWTNVDLKVVLDVQRKHIEILSSSPQIFDFLGLEKTSIVGGNVYSSYATDTNYTSVIIEIYIYDNNECYFVVTYNDIEYKYALTEAL